MVMNRAVWEAVFLNCRLPWLSHFTAPGGSKSRDSEPEASSSCNCTSVTATSRLSSRELAPTNFSEGASDPPASVEPPMESAHNCGKWREEHPQILLSTSPEQPHSPDSTPCDFSATRMKRDFTPLLLASSCTLKLRSTRTSPLFN